MNERITVYLLMEADRFFSPLNAAEKKLLAFGVAATATLTAMSMKLAASYESNLVGFTTLAQATGEKFNGVMSNVYGQIQKVDKEVAKLGGDATGEKFAAVSERVRGSLEGLTAEYRTTTEDAKKLGKQLLDDITALAVATPYATEELIAAGRTLVGYGVSVENLLPTLNAVGEVVAGVGGDLVKLQRITLAYGQVISKNKFYAQELRQFTESGVGAKDFADTLGVSVKEFLALMEAGQVGSDVVVKAFQRMTGEGGKFNGLMKDLMKTPAGRSNAVKESLQIQLRELGRRAWEGLEGGGFWGEVGRLMKDMQATGPAFGEKVKAAFSYGKSVLLGAEGTLQAMYEQLGRFKDFSLEVGPSSGASRYLHKTIQDARNINAYGQEDWTSSIMTLPYAIEEFVLAVKGVFIMGDRWVNTVLIPGIYEGFYEAMKVVVDILGKLWNGFMTGISRIVVPFYGKLDTSGAMVDTTASALHYAERLNWVDATRRKNVAIFNKAEQDNLNRINETQDKARALVADYKRKMGATNDFGIAGPAIKPLTLEEQLFGANNKLADFVGKVKTDFREARVSVDGFGESLSKVADKLFALDKANAPLKYAWKDVAAEVEKLTKNVRLWPTSPDLLTDARIGAMGGGGAIGLFKPKGVENFDFTPAPRNGLDVNFGKVFGVVGQVLSPLTTALSNSDFVDRAGNVGMDKIVKALADAGLDAKSQATEIRRMFAAGEIKIQGPLSDAEKAFGAGRLVDSLRKQPGWSDYQRALDTMPTAALRGSQEAADAINRARYGTGQTDLPTEIRALLEFLKQEEARRTKFESESKDILQKLLDNGTFLKVVGGPK